ncbi:MAG: DUF6113 family protein [Actinomycetota bacterium]|nr:DUF6113 family protein [Actinomycetota bacterium]
MRLATPLAAGVLGAVLGSLAGSLGTFVHRSDLHLSAASLPVGLVLALVLSVATVVLCGAATSSRLAAAAAAAGWLLAVLSLASRRAEGDVILAALPSGYVWLYGGTVAVMAAAAYPYGMLPRGWGPSPETGGGSSLDGPGRPADERR